MEEEKYEISIRYADTIKYIWIASFHISIIPELGFWAMIGLIMYYWVDKVDKIYLNFKIFSVI